MARKAAAPSRDPLAGFFRPQVAEPAEPSTAAPGTLLVATDQLHPDPTQPRQDWTHAEGERQLEELTASIQEFGILQPLLVGADGALSDGRMRYRVIAGARRLAAARRAGLPELPVVLRDEPVARVRLLQLVENLHRQDLAPLDEARSFQELLELERLSPQALAAKLCISGQHVRDRLRLLADQVLADAVQRRQISATAAREIMKLPDEEVAAFRARVATGEMLQTNDVAVARARMAADGVVHERRKRRADVPEAPAASAAPLSGAAQDQTTFDPVAIGQQGIQQNQTSFDPHDAVAPPAAGTPTEVPAIAQDGGPVPALEAAVTDEPEPALLAGVSEPVRNEIARVLRFGARAGWRCDQLLRHLGLT